MGQLEIQFQLLRMNFLNVHLQWQSLLSKMLAIPEALKSSLLPLCGAMQIVVSLNIAM